MKFFKRISYLSLFLMSLPVANLTYAGNALFQTIQPHPHLSVGQLFTSAPVGSGLLGDNMAGQFENTEGSPAFTRIQAVRVFAQTHTSGCSLGGSVYNPGGNDPNGYVFSNSTPFYLNPQGAYSLIAAAIGSVTDGGTYDFSIQLRSDTAATHRSNGWSCAQTSGYICLVLTCSTSTSSCSPASAPSICTFTTV